MLPSQRLKELIEDKGISYSDLEHETGLPESTIRRYASGFASKIPHYAIELLAPALGTSPAYVFAGRGKRDIPRSTTPPRNIKEPTQNDRLTHRITDDELKLAKKIMALPEEDRKRILDYVYILTRHRRK